VILVKRSLFKPKIQKEPLKLIIQIPCLNEEETLQKTLEDLPKKLPGIDQIEILIIDDGSTDGTVKRAIELGVDHVLSFPNNKGLARAFSAGLHACIYLNADIIVNTDADNQYYGGGISKIVEPILKHKADMVIGCRPISEMSEFSFLKKCLQRLGSFIVRQLSNTDIADATSGFRAFSRYAALRINVVSQFSYTLESIIQAGSRSITIVGVSISVNPKTRESRLFKSNWQYIVKSISIMLRLSTQFRPAKTFSLVGGLSLVSGFLLGVRYLNFFFTGSPSGHEQSSILSAILLLFGGFSFLAGLLADQIGANRQLIEEVIALQRDQYRQSQGYQIPYLIYSRPK